MVDSGTCYAQIRLKYLAHLFLAGSYQEAGLLESLKVECDFCFPLVSPFAVTCASMIALCVQNE